MVEEFVKSGRDQGFEVSSQRGQSSRGEQAAFSPVTNLSKEKLREIREKGIAGPRKYLNILLTENVHKAKAYGSMSGYEVLEKLIDALERDVVQLRRSGLTKDADNKEAMAHAARKRLEGMRERKRLEGMEKRSLNREGDSSQMLSEVGVEFDGEGLDMDDSQSYELGQGDYILKKKELFIHGLIRRGEASGVNGNVML